VSAISITAQPARPLAATRAPATRLAFNAPAISVCNAEIRRGGPRTALASARMDLANAIARARLAEPGTSVAYSPANAGQTPCEDACAADRQSCYESTCPGEDYCESCELQYNSCIANCNSGGGGECPTTSTQTSYGTVYSYPPFEGVCVGYGYNGTPYEKTEVYQDAATTTTTHNCDGSTTSQTQHQYTYLYCYYYQAYGSCAPATSFNVPTCY
jgi:hypothetical protein